MLGKKSKPVIEMFTGSLISGNRSEAAAAATTRSSRIQFETKSHSPKGLKSFDFGGVGLGIVAALENSGDEIPASKPLFGRNLSRSNPIPVNSLRNSSRTREICTDEMEMESLEEYTIVTRRAPNKSYTKIYNSDGRKGDDRTPFRIQTNNNTKKSRSSVFHISPARDGDVGIPPSDFLSSCNLCRKKLHGKDIYMYRGEKAFCSTECRYSQIVMDERKEKCSSEASRPAVAVEVAGSSPYATGQMFTTGILAI